MKYLYIPEDTYNLLNINKEHIITEEEALKLKIHKDIISKFIKHRALSIQFELGSGLFKNLELGLELIAQLNKIAVDIENIGDIFEKQQEDQRQKEEQ